MPAKAPCLSRSCHMISHKARASASVQWSRVEFTNVVDMKQKRSLLDYFGASPTPSKRKQRDESSTTSGSVQSSTVATASSEYVSHDSCSSTAHTSTNTDDTVASESSTEFSQCTNTVMYMYMTCPKGRE